MTTFAPAISPWHGPRDREVEVLVLDPDVGDADLLLAGLARPMPVVRLGRDGDPLGQIATALAGIGPVERLHILAHGTPGAVLVAGSRLDAAAIDASPERVRVLRGSFAGDAEIALWSCNVAWGDAGRAFVERLGAALGCAVSASTRPVGAGSPWSLDVGAATAAPVAASVQSAFRGVLTPVGPTANSDTLTGTAGADTIDGLGGNDVISSLAGADLLSGGIGNDTLYGGDDDDTLYGGAGNDFTYGQSGNDLSYGEAGNDGVSGGDGDDTLYGGDGNDTLMASSGDDLLFGDLGNDWLWGQKGNDTLYGGAGEDTLSGGAGNDSLFGGDDNDVLSGFSGDDFLYGDSGNDILRGASENDVLVGGDGDDTLSGGTGTDTLSGGAGNDLFYVKDDDVLADWSVGDVLRVYNGGALTLADIGRTGDTLTVVTKAGNLTTLTLTATGVDPSAVFSFSTSGNDALITYTVPQTGGGGGGGGDGGGDGGGESVFVVVPSAGGGGNASITNNGTTAGTAPIATDAGTGAAIRAAIVPAHAAVVASGPAAVATAAATATSFVQALEGLNPTGVAAMVGASNGFFGGTASSTFLFQQVTLTATTGVSAQPFAFSGTTGTGALESIIVDASGLAPGHTVQIDDIEIVAFTGSGTLTGGAGSNRITASDDVQVLSAGVSDDTVFAGGGDDFAFGNQGADILLGNAGADSVFGGQDDDVAFGGLDGDALFGNQANDVLFGNFGEDALYGGQGDDALYGGQGADTMIGGIGADTVVGGLGSDLFVFGSGGGNDVVADFRAEEGDRIEIAGDVNGTGIATAADILARLSADADGNAVIDLGDGNLLTLTGVSPTALSTADFSIV